MTTRKIIEEDEEEKDDASVVGDRLGAIEEDNPSESLQYSYDIIGLAASDGIEASQVMMS